jgi:hypothetical protein
VKKRASPRKRIKWSRPGRMAGEVGDCGDGKGAEADVEIDIDIDIDLMCGETIF